MKINDIWSITNEIEVFILLWAIFLLSTIPYLVNDVVRTNFGYLVTISLYCIVVAYLFLDFKTTRSIYAKSWNVLKNSPHFIAYCLSILFSSMVLAFFYNDEIDNYLLYKLFGYILMATMSYIVLPILVWPARLKQLWTSLMFIGMFCAIIGLLNLFANLNGLFGLEIIIPPHASPVFGIPATAGPFFEVNTYAVVLVVGMVGAFYFITKREKLFLAWFTFFVSIAALFFTWSRTMYIAVPALIWVSLFIGYKRKKRWLLSLFSLFCFASLVALVLTVPILRDIFELERGLTGRETLWSSAIDAIKARPISGWGMGGKQHMLNIMVNHGGIFRGMVLVPHNSFLEIGVQTGILPMFLFLTIFFVSIIRLLRSNIDIFEKRAIGSGMTTVFLGISTLTYSLGGISFIALILGIFWGTGNLSKINMNGDERYSKDIEK